MEDPIRFPDRRQMLLGLAALAALSQQSLQAQQTPASAGTGSLTTTRIFSPEPGPGQDGLKKLPNGSQRWNILQGSCATGEVLAMHESILLPGVPAPAPHTIQHSELIVVQEGSLELFHDGATQQAAAGSVLYVAYGTNHAVRNAGSTPARYFVFQIGGDTKKS